MDVWEEAHGPHVWKPSEIFLLVLIIGGLAFYAGYAFGHSSDARLPRHAVLTAPHGARFGGETVTFGP